MSTGDRISNHGQDAAGRAKEAAGAVTGDESLKSEGKADQAAASIKNAFEDVKDKASDAVDAIKDKLDGDKK